jgi:hypothetical protein
MRFCQDEPDTICFGERELSQSSDGGSNMVESKSKSGTTEFDPPRPDPRNTNRVGQAGVRHSLGDELDDETPMRGVVAIAIAREVIGRFSGTFILNELPERQPEIVFDHGRQFRDDDDES